MSSALRQSAGELRARLDAKLAERLVEVVLDSACADEQSGCDLSVRLPLRGEARDLRLLRSELVERVHGPLARTLACRQQLAFGAARERLGADRGELLESGAELLSSVGAATLAAQPLPIQQAGPGELESHAGTGEVLDRLAV